MPVNSIQSSSAREAQSRESLSKGLAWLSLREPRSIWSILWEGTTLYIRHAGMLTQPVLLPVASITIGILIALALPMAAFNALLQTGTLNPYVVMAISVVLIAPPMLVMTRGFWRYMVYWASLNATVLSVVQIEAERARSGTSLNRGFGPQQADAAADYKAVVSQPTAYVKLLLALMAIWIPCLVAPLLLLPGVVLMPQAVLFWLILGVLGFIGLTVITAVGSVFLLLGFQVAAYEGLEENPVITLKRSCQLVLGNYWRTTVLTIVLSIVLGTVAPAICVSALDMLGLTSVLSVGMNWLIRQQTAGLSPDMAFNTEWGAALAPAWGLLAGSLSMNDMSLGLTRCLAGTVFNALLLPWGTACYALLYGDIVIRRHQAAIPENPAFRPAVSQTL